uniref:Kunitz/Bovine pancreatic trypsin inhibitor domain protein n=1 Tax=Syphacia muris TaxID=451379 RepID=A0A158R566_9BILA
MFREVVYLNLLWLVTAQFYYFPVVQQRPVQVRTSYPIRTNCLNRCNNQNRYRWTFRQTGLPRPLISVALPAPNASTPKIDSTTPPTITSAATTTTVTAESTIQQTVATSAPTTVAENKPVPPVPPIFMRPMKKIPGATDMEASRTQNFVNPCVTGKPLSNVYGTPISCNYLVQPNGGCPEDYWCHTGATFTTTACCPIIERVPRCEQPRTVGGGNELVARWYFDTTSKQCKRFLYKGLLGNANNFITKAQCTEACETDQTVDTQNPCKYGTPARDSNQKLIVCGSSNDTQCPKGYYCHIGETPTDTVCCEGSGLSDPCLLSLNVGQGKALIKRFYYNTLAKQCAEFVYKGYRGNENNFLTIEECQQKCIKWTSPCPTLFDYAEQIECSRENRQCAKGQWCHIGSTKQTTTCCPGAIENPCTQPLLIGEGNENLTRWYADPSDRSCIRQCKSFTYKGTKGNQNNFLTKAECEETCKPQCVNPCGNNSMLLEPSGVPRQCGPTWPCPNTHWCHVGGNVDTTVCCSGSSNPCTLPMVIGHGDHRLTRWRFSINENKCVSFIYHGLGGNQNMFLTADDCRAVCPSYVNPCGSGKPLMVGSKPKICSPHERCPSTHFCHIGTAGMDNVCCFKNGDPCDLSMSEGVGNGQLSRYYYDKDTHCCREFTYRGSKGNANNFLSQEDCELVCPVYPNPCGEGEPFLDEKREPLICGGSETCPTGYFCHVGGSPETTNCCPGTRKSCDQMLEIGKGTERLERWFFDGSVQLCRNFIYRGTKGNANNFLSRESCQSACKEMNPCGKGEPLVDSNGERILCTGGQRLDSCPKTHYCHVGASSLTTLCCKKTNIDPCEQEKAEGYGGDALPRWYFDSRLNKCIKFEYGGMGGNENNFISKQTCDEVCPEYRGYCPHGQPLIESNGREPISCGIDKACPAGFICHMSAEYNVSICCQDPADFCLQPRDPGPCVDFEKRYGYHPLSDTCVEYEYGGCGGTLNNFKSLQRCTEICCKEYKKKL